MLKTEVWSFGVPSLLTPESTYFDAFVAGVIPLLVIVKDGQNTIQYVTLFNFSGKRRHKIPCKPSLLGNKTCFQINANAVCYKHRKQTKCIDYFICLMFRPFYENRG